MKNFIYSLFTALLIGLVIYSCEENKDKGDGDAKKSVITGQLVSNSPCKDDLFLKSQIVVAPDSISRVEYSFDNNTNKLIMKHINAGFNCCPDSLYCKIELKGDTILIQEFEKEAGCKCNCLYDMDIEINGVGMNQYQVKFVEPYAGEMDKIEFEIDLANAANGSFSVIRKRYPWCVYSMEE